MAKWLPSPGELDAARDATEKLRTSDDPQWRDVRSRLLEAGVRPEDAVLGDQVSAGRHSLGCLAISRDARVFSFSLIFGYDRDGEPLPKGQARVGRWNEIPAERVRLTEDGVPNSWLRGVFIAREVFADDGVQST
jgi:hypothetical protein